MKYYEIQNNKWSQDKWLQEWTETCIAVYYMIYEVEPRKVNLYDDNLNYVGIGLY